MRPKIIITVLIIGLLSGIFMGPLFYKKVFCEAVGTMYAYMQTFYFDNYFKDYCDSPIYVKEYRLFRYRFNKVNINRITVSLGSGHAVLVAGLREKLYYFVLRNSSDFLKNWVKDRYFLNIPLISESNLKKGSLKVIGCNGVIEPCILRRVAFRWKELGLIYRVIAFEGLRKRKEVKELYYVMEVLGGSRKKLKKIIGGFVKEYEDAIKNSENGNKKSVFYYRDKFIEDFYPYYLKYYKSILKELDKGKENGE